jgi:hypothetical protein
MTPGSLAPVEDPHLASYKQATMTKKDVVALAHLLRIHNQTAGGPTEFTPDHLRVLADFCASQDPAFNRDRWIHYIAGEGGQGDELILVRPDSPLIPGAILNDKLESLKPQRRRSK